MRGPNPHTDSRWSWIDRTHRLRDGSFEELLAECEQGRVARDALVSRLGSQVWMPLSRALEPDPTLPGARSSPPPAAHDIPAARRAADWPALLVLVFGAITVAAVGALALVLAPRPAPPKGPSAPVLAAATSVRPPVPVHCVVAGRSRVAAQVSPSAPIGVGRFDERGFALGYALDRHRAELALVDGATLAVTETRSFASDVPFEAAVPVVRGSEISLARDLSLRTVGPEGSVSFGMAPEGFVRVPEGGPAVVLWPGAARDLITRPELAQGESAWAVTFLRGATRTFRFGWLTPRGERQSELFALSSPGPAHGEPGLALGAVALLVTSARTPEGVRALFASRARVGDEPEPWSRLRIPGAGAAEPVTAAVVAALRGPPTGQWLIAWHAGSPAMLWAQRFDADLAPLGTPLEVSSPGALGRSAVLAYDGGVLVAHLLASGATTELWVARIACE